MSEQPKPIVGVPQEHKPFPQHNDGERWTVYVCAKHDWLGIETGDPVDCLCAECAEVCAPVEVIPAHRADALAEAVEDVINRSRPGYHLVLQAALFRYRQSTQKGA